MGVHTGTPLRLNIGAGGKVIDGWTSVDVAGEPDIRADVRELPLQDACADEAMAIHVLEHLYRWEALDALREWRRVLKPGSVLAVEVPDLLKVCRHVLAGADARMGQWGLFGDPGYREPLMCHRWCYTADELIELMREAGFSKVKQRVPQFHKPSRDMRIEGRA